MAHAAELGYTVQIRDLPENGPRGWCDPKRQEIVIADGTANTRAPPRRHTAATRTRSTAATTATSSAVAHAVDAERADRSGSGCGDAGRVAGLVKRRVGRSTRLRVEEGAKTGIKAVWRTIQTSCEGQARERAAPWVRLPPLSSGSLLP
jgi:hypothetical protein